MPSVLVMDDDPAIRVFLTELLGDEGSTTSGVDNGMMAVHMLAMTLPDLIITDLMMPMMDGIALCAYLHANPVTATSPIIIWSAAPTSPLLMDCRYTALLTKPCPISTLLETMMTILPV